MKPQNTKQWMQINEVDYRHKLNDDEKKFLDTFNRDMYAKRPRVDAMSCPTLHLSDSAWTELGEVYQARPTYTGVSLADINLYRQLKREKKSERQLAKELGMPRSTFKYRIRLVEALLRDVDWSNLLPTRSNENGRDSGGDSNE